MTSHLSSGRIEMLLSGRATREEEQHAAGCLQCAAEISRLTETLSIFRDSVHAWAAHRSEAALSFGSSERARFRRFGIARFAWALALVSFLLIAIPLYRMARDPQQDAVTVDDAVLLEQVNAQLSRVVPAPMEPYM